MEFYETASVVKGSRPLADYHPDLWTSRFLENTSEHELQIHKKQLVENLKEQVRRELYATTNKPSQQLQLIDAIQRLGIAYHFEVEIEEALQHLHDTYHGWLDKADISCVAISFRLLRQQGYNISSEIFNSFIDDKGDFKESLIADSHGLLALYEAACLRFHGENILDHALTFTTTYLMSVANGLGDTLAKQVSHALNRPIRKGMTRLEAWHHISFYQEDSSHNETISKFAKVDFNLLQSLHKKELSEITRWWKELDFATKLPFVRHRITESFFWAMGVCYEPQYSLSRKLLARMIEMMTMIDDIYDAYGTFPELELFTEAIERWSIDSLDELPDYMKVCYKGLLDLFEEIEKEMANKGALYRIHYAKESMKFLVRGYFAEAKWLKEAYMPTMDDYMSTALMTAGSITLLTTVFIGMGEIVTKEILDWLFSQPKIFKASIAISRLLGDMGSYKFERNRKHIPSAIECYIQQYKVSEQQAKEELCKQIEDARMDINEELLRPTVVPRPLLVHVLNLDRIVDVLYKDGDIFTQSGKQMKEYIKALLVDPIPE